VTGVSDRVAFKELCIATLQAHFAGTEDHQGVTVHYDWWGEVPSDHMVVLGAIKGNSEAVVFGPAGSDDEFTIDSFLLTSGGDTVEEADRRAQAILNEVNAALFQSRFAASLQGRAFPGTQDGPNGTDPQDGNPAASVVEFSIGCSISLRGA
jgi:hypothetical protein